MATLTDPARELADLAERIKATSKKRGDAYLAEMFDVDTHDANFARIITCILERTELVESIVEKSTMDSDHQETVLAELVRFRQFFTPAQLANHWLQGSQGEFTGCIRALQLLSPMVRNHTSYPRLSAAEVSEFIGLIDAYLGEIRENQDLPNLVRQSISDGMYAFRFQLQEIGWLGSGYALAAFRQIMMSCELIQRDIQGQHNPDAEAALRGLATILKQFKAKVDEATGWTDTGQSVFSAYQLTTTLATPLLIGQALISR
ncbi:hypothetical protein [Sphingomonas sp. LT1P40]|uniref:hypothetical protein n=1 Tax=Alteristakelama amylovorans TaxID=3096166 RepID=UPI002FCAD98F